MRKTAMRVSSDKKKSDGVRVDHEKERWVRVPHDKKSDGVRVHHKKKRWGES